uniref:Uncharacterized protein n=1 Tax=Mycena chlorophos TaxID=658473 RepID=A0ABQ0LP12_MYCCL|nr:predicted protein [Mycena chlorophos]
MAESRSEMLVLRRPRWYPVPMNATFVLRHDMPSGRLSKRGAAACSQACSDSAWHSPSLTYFGGLVDEEDSTPKSTAETAPLPKDSLRPAQPLTKLSYEKDPVARCRTNGSPIASPFVAFRRGYSRRQCSITRLRIEQYVLCGFLPSCTYPHPFRAPCYHPCLRA